jgi:hypothetical protein
LERRLLGTAFSLVRGLLPARAWEPSMQRGALSWRQFEANLPEPDLQNEAGASASVSHPSGRI